MIAITGHTRGIGAGLYAHLSPNVKGFSRANGFDINSASDRARIVLEAKDCDVFINNAHSGFAQTYMLLDMFRAWKDLDKTIINVGSRVIDSVLPASRYDLLNYQAEKLSLKQMIGLLQGHACQITYKSFGFVGTAGILQRYPKFTADDYIPVDQAVKIILS